MSLKCLQFIVGVLCSFEHQNRIVDFQGRSQFNAHYLHKIHLGEQQKCLSINLLQKERLNEESLEDTANLIHFFLVQVLFLTTAGISELRNYKHQYPLHAFPI